MHRVPAGSTIDKFIMGWAGWRLQPVGLCGVMVGGGAGPMVCTAWSTMGSAIEPSVGSRVGSKLGRRVGVGR